MRGAGKMNTEANVLIIEDESIIAADLACIVEQVGLRVCGVAKTSAEAIALAKLTPVSLILSDMRLADGSSGIRAVEEILEAHDATVIFISACPQQVPASLMESAFVIMKPYREATVTMAIEHAMARQCDCPKLYPCACASPHPPE
jgi:DNA-binding NtrC family response regulator